MAKKNAEELMEVVEKKTVNSEKLKALQLTLDKLEKTYGKGTVMKLGDSKIEAMEVISTGSLGLDIALGVGGYPKGRVVEIFGPESSGKTTLALHAMAESQKAGGIAAFIDAEHAFDRFYAEKKFDQRSVYESFIYCRFCRSRRRAFFSGYTAKDIYQVI